jgi:hypothetical protein
MLKNKVLSPVHPWPLGGAFSKSLPGLMLAPLLLTLLALGLSGCERDGASIAESQYAATLVGDWQGSAGETKETIRFRADGRFSARVRPMGFISNTLDQGTTGTIRGTWAVQGKIITLTVDSAENERLLNRTTTSRIMTFQQNELVVKSATGETSTFLRVL